MSSTFNNTIRQAIPRCLDYSTVCALGLLRAEREHSIKIKPEFQISSVISKWQKNPNIYTAVELLAEALILKDFESEDSIRAANYLLNQSKTINPIIKELASHFLEPPSFNIALLFNISEPQERYTSIANLKKSVRFYHRNPIAWCDMAINYATLGQMDKARTALEVALNLAPNNRFILRSASRCFLHFREPDRAVHLLSHSPLYNFDPWITSAGIAIAESADLPTKSINKAKALVEDDSLTPFSRSELSVSIGTKEMKNGAEKRAKTYMRQGIINPTENALAQAEWMSSQLGTGISNFFQLGNKVPASYEAIARHLFYKEDFKNSLNSARNWCSYEPLSSMPFIFASYIASLCLDNDLEALNILKNALPLYRTDPDFMNNYICSLARTGDLKPAIENFMNLDLRNLTDYQIFLLTATQGLLCFRTDNAEKGRELYLEAIRGFERINQHYSAAIASYYWAYEEKRILSPYKDARIKDAKSRVKRFKVFELTKLINKL
jgi:tetratricopeptide (TPR) repeat protein